MFLYSSFLSNTYNTIFSVIFFIVTWTFIIVFIKVVTKWSINNKQPILDVECTVISKKLETKTSINSSKSNKTLTNYYITFELKSTKIIELKVNKREYCMIKENDKGRLTFQCTKFLGFQRV